MAELTITIPTDKVERVKKSLFKVYPIPQIADPEWIDPEDGTIAPIINEFTDIEWAKQCILNFIKRTVARQEQKDAKDAIAYSEDDTLIE